MAVVDEPEPAKRFLRTYNELDEFLRRNIRADPRQGFASVVTQFAADKASLGEWAWEVKSFGQLRNAIVHGTQFPAKVIAVPTEEAIKRFVQLSVAVLEPRTAASICSGEVRLFEDSEPLIDALGLMKREDFSQVVVRMAGELRLLSVEGVAGWLEAHVPGRHVEIEGARIADALAHELPGTLLVLAEESPIWEVKEAFLDLTRHPRLFAALVTKSGRLTEPPIGIITPWDLLKDGGP